MKADFRLARNIAISAMLAAAWSVAPAADESQQGGTSAGKSDASRNLDSKDRKFIEKAATDGMAEVELGKLAQSKASSDQVKEFGSHMEQEHTQANNELKQIAQSKGVTVPASPDRSHSKKVEKMGQESGADFDKKYMAEMVKEHEKDLKLFQEAAQNAKDPEIKAFAQKGAQKISQHLTMAKQIAGQMGGDKSGMNETDQRPNAESSRADSRSTTAGTNSTK